MMGKLFFSGLVGYKLLKDKIKRDKIKISNHEIKQNKNRIIANCDIMEIIVDWQGDKSL
jgi:hypothetical protein